MDDNSKQIEIIEIMPTPNGPLMIKGKMKIFDENGNILKEEIVVTSLCRCGCSSNKPFCDGTHTKVSFNSSIGVQNYCDCDCNGKCESNNECECKKCDHEDCNCAEDDTK